MDQNIITLAIVFSTVLYIFFSLYRSLRRKTKKCDGCSGCSLSQLKKDIVVNKVNAQQLSYKRL